VSVAPSLFEDVGVATACLAMAAACGAAALVGSVFVARRVARRPQLRARLERVLYDTDGLSAGTGRGRPAHA
jgi:hypothetical protein